MPVRPPTFRSAMAATMPRDPRPNSNARGYDADWRRVRDDHLARHPVCAVCEARGRSTPATVVDHRSPIAVDPSRRLDLTNLRSVCVPCHGEITTRFKTEGINEPRLSFATHRTLLGA